MATFDPNRVGPGTFELVKDPSTGEYKLKQVGFFKLPDLSLPTIDQAPYLVPDDGDDDNGDDNQTPDPGTGTGGGGSGGGGGDSLDLTRLRTPDDQIDQAAQISQNLRAFSSDTAQEQFRRQTTLPTNKFLVSGAAGGARLSELNEDLIDRGNPTGDSRIVSEEQGLTGDAASKFAQARQAMTMPVNYNLPEARSPVPYSNLDPYQQNFLDKAPGFETRVSMVPDVAAPVKTTATQFGVPDAVKFGQPSLPDPVSEPKKNILKTAENFVKNNTSIKALGFGMKTIAEAGVAIGDAILGVTDVDRRRREADSSAAKSLGYTTVGELGGSTDPGRIASVRLADGTIATSSADSVFVGFNRDSAKGNLSQAAANRIETRMTVGQARVDKKYGANSKQANDFRQKTKDFQKEANDFNSKKETEKKEKSQNPNLRAGAGGEGGSKGGGKIVCTMMNESYGFGSFRNKIWMKFHGNISPEYQKGYHKLFLPLVNYAKQKGITNKIIKNILEHIAVHSTIDMRQSLRGKTHMLGRVYRKIILPLCYWAGRK